MDAIADRFVKPIEYFIKKYIRYLQKTKMPTKEQIRQQMSRQKMKL